MSDVSSYYGKLQLLLLSRVTGQAEEIRRTQAACTVETHAHTRVAALLITPHQGQRTLCVSTIKLDTQSSELKLCSPITELQSASHAPGPLTHSGGAAAIETDGRTPGCGVHEFRRERGVRAALLANLLRVEGKN